MTPCKGCKKPIEWGLESGTSKKHPLDPRPPVYRILDRMTDGTVMVERDEYAMVTHFATCREAKQFSKGGRNAAAKASRNRTSRQADSP